jgi:hypothetical protein
VTVSARRWLEQHARWIAVALLLVFFGRLLDAAAREAVTFDEVLHVLQGALYWREETLYAVVRNPPLVNALIGLPVDLLGRPTLPPDLARYANQDWLEISKTFMWELNAHGLLLSWLGRLSIISLALLLAALVTRWAGQLFRARRAGLLALFLVTFDPNILAHGSLATTDLGTAFFFLLAGYLLWRYWTAVDAGRKTAVPLLLAGTAVGLALAAKFSGIVVVLALLLMSGWRFVKERPRRQTTARIVGEVGLLLGTAVIVFLLVYRFQFATLRLDFALQQAHQLGGHSAYLWGKLSREGWWYYLPLLFLVKTPLPVLFLLLLTLISLWRGRDFGWAILWPLLLAAGVFGAGLASSASIGYRYMLPALPLLYVSMGRLAVAEVWTKRPWQPWLTSAALVALGVVSLVLHPHYLAYFNLLAGGPQNGWRVAVDSNIDWGQDLARVGEVMAERGATEVYANWLGTAPLEVYGIPGETLDGWPWSGEEALLDPFYPPRPAPGLYALSVTQLLGVYLDDPARFSWFQAREPDAKAGYSIFMYEVPTEGEPAGLALSGIGVSDITEADFAEAFSGNNVQPRWFDARTSLLWPGGGNTAAWAAVGNGHLPENALLQELYPAEGPILRGKSASGLDYGLYQWLNRPFPAGSPEQDALFGETLRLMSSVRTPTPAHPGETVSLRSTWAVEQDLGRDTAQLALFVHLLDENGRVVAQHDGLDVQLRGLRAGDWFAQLHELPIAADLPPGHYALQIGVYDPGTGARLTQANGSDRMLLEPLTVVGE